MSSIASVSSPPKLHPIKESDPQQPAVKPVSPESRRAPPPAVAALPPGQGTRVNIFA